MAAPNTSGYRHSTATALNAPIEAPAVTTADAEPPESATTAGSTSHRTHSWNWLSSHIRCSTEPSLATMARPATLSTEYSLIWPSASSGPHASTSPCRSISSASPPADGKTSTGRPNSPHRTTVTSSCIREEYHRSRTFSSSAIANRQESLVVELLRTRENPGQPGAQPVPPVLPAVPVARLDVPDRHPGALEHRDHGPVRDDQRLIHAAADEQPVGHPPRRGPVPVHELDHRLEHRPAAVVVPDVGEHERPGLQQQRPVHLRVPVRGGQRRHRPEAGSHQAPPGSTLHQRQLRREPRHQLRGQVPGVGRRVRVFRQSVARIDKSGHQLGHVEPVDEVVQHRLGRRVPQVVPAVVHDQQRIPRRTPEPRRQVHRHPRLTAQRAARHHHVHQRPRPCLGIGKRPLRHDVPVRVAHRRIADRAARQPRIERVVEPRPTPAAHHLQLIFHPGSGRQLQHRVPQVHTVHPAHRQVVRQPEDPVHHERLVRLAPEQERAARPLDDRHVVAGQEPGHEPVHGAGVQRPPLPQPVDRQLAPRGHDRRGTHAASPSAETCPSKPSTRAPAGKPPLEATSTRVPASKGTHTAGAKRRANTAIRGASSSSSRALACGSRTTSRTRLSPLPYTSACPGPCADLSPNSTIRSAIAIAPADHAMTAADGGSEAATLNRCSTSASSSLNDPATTTAAAPSSKEATEARCAAITGRSCGRSRSKNSPRTSFTRARCAASSSCTASTASPSAAPASADRCCSAYTACSA